MPQKELVTKVWIAPGCIICDACETASPDVFEVRHDENTCVIRPAALETAFTKPRTKSIIEAAEECPVDVIKFDLAPFELTAEEAAQFEAEAEEAAPAAASHAPAAAAHAPAAASLASASAPVPKAPPAPVAAVVDSGDPLLQALLRAATARGGSALIAKAKGGLISGDPLKAKDISELPPDARFARTLNRAKEVKKNKLTRREAMSMVVTAAWGGMALTGAVWGLGSVSFSMPRALEEPDPRVRVGDLKKYVEMKPGEVNEDYKPKGIWMIREEERIAALNIICTHLGCIPNWLPNDRYFLCPCHGSGYYFSGINFQGPTPRPLERFKISVEDGIVVVDKSKKFQYELGQWDMPDASLAV